LPNKSTRLVLVAIVAAALLAVGVNLMNLHRTASTPIVITTPAGAAAASTLVPAAPAPKATLFPRLCLRPLMMKRLTLHLKQPP